MPQNLVETTRLTKRYGKHAAVDSVDLTVQRGEVMGFLGPNGAGKTTTMRMLMGLVRPTSGEALVLGMAPGDPRALGRIGMLVEVPAFYPYLSGRDNLGVFARYSRLPADSVEHVLRVVGLAGRAGDKFVKYSLGMKQRLGVASALLKKPDLLILDEPTNGLDPAGMADMRQLVRSLGEQGHTVLLSSHLMAEVQEICDRVAVIAGGALLRTGTVAELRGQGALEVTLEQVDEARDLLERRYGPEQVAAEDGGVLRLSVPRGDSALVNRYLISAGIDVHELRWVDRTLEDIFFEMTAFPAERHLTSVEETT